jgi:hypothetical protein
MSQTCMKSNLQGQDLSEIIGGNDTKLNSKKYKVKIKI